MDLLEWCISMIQILIPQPCYDEFFRNYNFFNAMCLKMVLSKCLGYAIVVGSSVVKVPQIVKIIQMKSAQGISIVSVTLELTAITATLSYSVFKGFPFSTFGESVFLMLQTSLIAFLIFVFSGQVMGGVVYTSVYGAILSFLLSSAAPSSLLWGLQASVMPIVILARTIQAMTNYNNHSTGQLSIITWLLLLLGSVARVFTSVQETGDVTVILSYCVSSASNSVIVLQILYYWRNSSESRPHED